MDVMQNNEPARVLQTTLLDFVRANLHELNQPGSYANAEDGDFKLRDKIILETALLLYVIDRSFPAHDALSQRLKACAQEVAALAAEPRIIALIHKNPQYSLVLGLSFICLRKLGFNNPHYEALLKRILALNKTHTSEKIPFRELDIQWVRYLHNNREKPRITNHTSSVLSLNTSPIYMSKSDAYGVTHAIMYLTDFGASVELLKGYDKNNIHQLLHYGLIWCISVADFDLTAELLMAYYFCRFEETAITTLCANIIEDTYQRVGYLPGPCFDSAAHAKLERSERDVYLFQNVYHTTYVFGLYLCASTLYKKQQRHEAVAGHNTLKKSAQNKAVVRAANLKVRTLLKSRFAVGGIGAFKFAEYYSSEAPLRYLSHVTELASPESLLLREVNQRSWPAAAACRLLLDALIIGLSKDYSLERLVDVLCVGLNHFPAIAHEFLFQEAVEFLALQQTTEGAIGTFFYRPENFEEKKNEAILFHAKVIHLFDSYLAQV